MTTSQQSDLTVKQLREENARLLALLARQESTIETLRHQLHLFRHASFGRKSEKGVVPEQMALQFDEAEPSSEQEELTAEPSQTETITYTRAKKGTGRKTLPKSLPYVEQIHDLSDEEKHCDCGCELTHIGDDITEQLDVVPQMTFRVVHVRKKYACKACEETIQTAKLRSHKASRHLVYWQPLSMPILTAICRFIVRRRCLKKRTFLSPEQRFATGW